MHRNGHIREQSTIETQQLTLTRSFYIRIWSVLTNLAFAMLNFHYNNKSAMAIRIVLGSTKVSGQVLFLLCLIYGLAVCPFVVVIIIAISFWHSVPANCNRCYAKFEVRSFWLELILDYNENIIAK